MADGRTRDGAAWDRIDDTAADAGLAAPVGDGGSFRMLRMLEGRRRAIPGARTCVTHQNGRDRPLAAASDRRGRSAGRPR